MVGSVYTEERFTMIDLGMDGPFGWHPDSHVYSLTSHHLLYLFFLFELKTILNLQYVYCSVKQFDYNIAHSENQHTET